MPEWQLSVEMVIRDKPDHGMDKINILKYGWSLNTVDWRRIVVDDEEHMR